MREWDPPHRVVFEWRQAGFAEDQSTEVAVRFDPVESGTRVTVEHFGWDTHPAGARRPPRLPPGRVPTPRGRVVAGAAAVAARPRRHLSRGATPPSVARWPPDPASTSSPTTRRRSGARAPTPPPAREPSHAERCRTLVHGERRGALSTVAADPAGYPFGSVVSFGLADDGDPLFFVSLMAEHTQNALRDPRASLLVTEPVPDGADPLASGRVTLLGLLAPVDDDDARRRPGALPRRQPGGVVLHRLRRLHLPAARPSTTSATSAATGA